MPEANKIGKPCATHNKVCDLYCTFQKCHKKIICEKCVIEHLDIHPKQFIYSIDNLSEIHSFDKVRKMKEELGREKVQNEQRIGHIYENFANLIDPLMIRIQKFQKHSESLIQAELVSYLQKAKNIIETTEIEKTDSKEIRDNPQQMILESIKEVDQIKKKEEEMKQCTEKYNWYVDNTEQLCEEARIEIEKLVKVSLTMLDTYEKIQVERFYDKCMMDGHHERSFYMKYSNTLEIAGKEDKKIRELEILQTKKEVARKDAEVKRVEDIIKEKMNLINSYRTKINILTEEVLRYEQKKEIELTEKREIQRKQKRKEEEYLSKLQVILDNGRTISMEKKQMELKHINLIFELIPNPQTLILSQHYLSQDELGLFSNLPYLKVLKMSFMPCDKKFLSKSLKNYKNLEKLELNSSKIDDETLSEISVHFPESLKHLHLIDNEISDEGLESLFKNFQFELESLFVSYNYLTDKAIEILKKTNSRLRILHISKNQIKSKGAIALGKYFKELEELFLGGTGVQKDGIMSISRNCVKIKRLSLVSLELTSELVSEILLGLTRLEWLDISYSHLSDESLQKIEKLKVFNKTLEIVVEK